MWLFKICGLILITIVCTALGLLKAGAVKKRYQKILYFSRCLRELAEKIRVNSGEIADLLRQNFSADLLIFEGDIADINPEFLQKEDCSLLKECLQGIGMGDITAEYSRISAYCEIIKQHGEDLQTSGAELIKLYKSAGFLCGIFICIFFL